MTLFFGLLNSKNKHQSLIDASFNFRNGNYDSNIFDVQPISFKSLPSASFAYWVSEAIRRVFGSMPAFESAETGFVARRGVNSNDDFRFLRSWVEVNSKSERWINHPKGGAFKPFYSDAHLVVDWHLEGEYLKTERVTDRVYAYAIVPSKDLYFRPGLTWTRRTQGGLSLRVMPRGSIFADKGPAAFVSDDNVDELLALLAITNSQAFEVLVSLQMAFGSYEVGVIQKTPVPVLSREQQTPLAILSRRAWSLKRSLDTVEETSHAFLLPAAILVNLGYYDVPSIDAELARIQAEINGIVFGLYKFSEVDRAATIASAESRGGSAAEEEDEDAGPVDQTNALLRARPERVERLGRS